MDISYSKIKIDFDKSHDSYVFDKNTNREYLDFMSMFSSLPLGYNHEIFNDENFLNESRKISKMRVTNCEYSSDEKEEFVKEFKRFCSLNIFNNIHFTCTGALAVESAIKMAMIHKGVKDPIIISFRNSFHGITSFGNFVTPKDGATFNRLDGYPWEDMWPKVSSLQEIKDVFREFKDRVAGIIVEPIQSTAGDIYIDEFTLQGVRDITTENNIPLIFDEIQTGFGSTGKVWYFQYTDIIPDIICFGKKSQVAGIMVKDEFASGFKSPQKFCITWDGDLIDMVRSKYIIKEINRSKLLNNAKEKGKYLKDKLSEIKELKNIRGTGLLLAFELETKKKRDSVCKLSLNYGLLINPTGINSIRLRPNLNVNYLDIDKAVKIISSSVRESIQ